jgi:hypothetical protein
LKQIPKRQQAAVLELLLAWLVHEDDADTRDLLLETLGQWPGEVENLVLSLLDLPGEASELSTALCTALARLAVRVPDRQDDIKNRFRDNLPASPAAMGLARLATAIAQKERKPETRIPALMGKVNDWISDPQVTLQAFLEAGSDDDPWDDNFHGLLTSAVQNHVETHPELLLKLLAHLRKTLAEESWPARRMALAAVAACTEIMPTAVQRACPNNDLEKMLVKGTTDSQSHNSPRFALTALSYLRKITPAVVSALLAGCQDTEIVQRDAIVAAGRFQSIQGDPLPDLIPVLTGESQSTTYAVTQVLGMLGASAAGVAASLRNEIITALVEALEHPNSQKEVFIAESEHSNELTSKGKLEDTLCEALLRVAGWPS